MEDPALPLDGSFRRETKGDFRGSGAPNNDGVTDCRSRAYAAARTPKSMSLAIVHKASVRRVRLAELVAALSLGIDLGFGQPMEHILRQCLIALNLAEQIGLDGESRAVVYYTALLINVGCHTDAHEQAKWFGNNINT